MLVVFWLALLDLISQCQRYIFIVGIDYKRHISEEFGRHISDTSTMRWEILLCTPAVWPSGHMLFLDTLCQAVARRFAVAKICGKTYIDTSEQITENKGSLAASANNAVVRPIQLIVYSFITQQWLIVLVTTTPEPTPRPRIEYQIATWSLVGASIITLIIIASLGITLWLRTRALWQPSGLAVSQSLLHGDLWCR